MGVGGLLTLAEQAKKEWRTGGFSGAGQGPESIPEKILTADPDAPVSRYYEIQGIDDRIHHIRALINKYKSHRKIYEASRKIVMSCPERSWKCELSSVYKFMRHAVRYRRDINKVDTYQSPLKTFEWRAGDCDDFTIAIASLCEALGYQSLLEVIQTKNAKDFNHIFPLILVPPRGKNRKKVAMDASVPRWMGWHPKHEGLVAKSKIYTV